MVDFQLAKKSGEHLKAVFGGAATVMHVQRKAHQPKGAEVEAATQFMQTMLATSDLSPTARDIARLAVGAVVAAASKGPSKRLRALANYRPPDRVRRPYAAAFRSSATVQFDRAHYDFVEAFATDLGGRGPQAVLGQGSGVRPEDCPQRVRDQCLALCAVYERFVREVIAPHLRTVGGGAADAPVLYQFPPTVRVQP